MSALFNFQSLVVVILLIICTCTYLRGSTSAIQNFMDQHRTGFSGIFWKAARIGERKSAWVSAFCIGMGLLLLFGN